MILYFLLNVWVNKVERTKKILSLIMIFSLFSFYSILSLSTSEAHILLIGDSKSDLPDYYNKAVELANKLKNQGYEVLELYRKDATTKNILKGMYDADAVIYIGHGGYQSGNYNGDGGTAKPPFAIVGSTDFIWGIGDKMREGWNSPLFTPPFKQNIPVILLNTCFSTGWAENKQVANPVETIYNFAAMFKGANANYYASAYGDEIIDDFLNGAKNFADANNKNYEKIVKSTLYGNTLVWRNDHGHTAFIGDWSGIFPSVASTTKYDDAAAEAWYNSGRTRNICFSKFSVISGPHYLNQAIKFTDLSSSGEKRVVNYHWNYGDGTYQSSSTPINPSHTYSKTGIFTVKLTITDDEGKKYSSIKTIKVVDKNSKKPDLTVTRGYKSGNYAYVTVKNQGTATSKSCYTRVWHTYYVYKKYHKRVRIGTRYYYKPYYKKIKKVYYKNIYTDALKPGTSKKYRVYFKYRRGTTKVDYYNKVLELNEKNNIKSF